MINVIKKSSFNCNIKFWYEFFIDELPQQGGKILSLIKHYTIFMTNMLCLDFLSTMMVFFFPLHWTTLKNSIKNGFALIAVIDRGYGFLSRIQFKKCVN